MSTSTHSDEGLTPSKPHPAPKQDTPPTAAPAAPVADHTPSAVDHTPSEQQVVEIKPTLKQKDVPGLNKGPGWYQQMFQSFSNTVHDAFPDGKQNNECASLKYQS